MTYTKNLQLINIRGVMLHFRYKKAELLKLGLKIRKKSE